MGRLVKLTTANAMPIDAYKGLITKIEALEAAYLADPTAVADVTGVNAVITGTTHKFIYIFTFTSVMATGEYTAAFTEQATSTEESEILNPAPPEGFAARAALLDSSDEAFSGEILGMTVSGELGIDDTSKAKSKSSK